MNKEYDYIPTSHKSNGGLAIASLICGLGSLVFNPCGLVALAAIILGIIALCTNGGSKTFAIIGIVAGFVCPVINYVVDTILSIFSAGILSFLYFI